MIILKIISPIIVLFLSYIQFRINDSITPTNNKYKKLSKLFLLLITLAIIFTIIITIINEIHSKSLENDLNDLKNIAVQADSSSSSRDSLATIERKSLENQITDLQGKLDPFISIAQEKYPSLTVDEGLDSLKYEIELIKNKTIGLENYISERKLSQSQIDRMKQILDANPKGPVIISCVANVPEAYSYAKQIYDTFKNSNWDIKGINTTQFFSDPHRGLVIKINDPNNIPQHVKTIEKLLSFLDINAKGQHSKKVPVGALEILIGFKN